MITATVEAGQRVQIPPLLSMPCCQPIVQVNSRHHRSRADTTHYFARASGAISW